MKETGGKRGAVLFVHGIVGNSRFFDFLLPLIPQEFATRCITLAGHGGDALAFSRASMKQWRQQVEDAVEELRSKYGHVVITAHSMGTLFAIEQAARGRADALFLLNLPLRIRLTHRLFVTPVKVMLGLTSDPLTAAAKEAYGVSIDYNPFHYYGWPRRYLELFAEIKRVRRLVGRVHCPTAIFVAEHDEMVSPCSALYFKSQTKTHIFALPLSGHYYYDPADRSIIMRGFTDLMQHAIDGKASRE